MEEKKELCTKEKLLNAIQSDTTNKPQKYAIC